MMICTVVICVCAYLNGAAAFKTLFVETMDHFATLEPVKLYVQKPAGTFRKKVLRPATIPNLIGRLPVEIHLLVLSFTAIPDVPAYCRASHTLAELARSERVWEDKWNAFGLTEELERVIDELESHEELPNRTIPLRQPSNADDDFGEFTSSTNTETHGVQDIVSSPVVSLSSHPAALSDKNTHRRKFIRVHNILKPLLPFLSHPPHLVLSSIFPPPTPSLTFQAKILHILALFLSSSVRPVRNHVSLHAAVLAVIDRFQASLLSAFDVADGHHDEANMRVVAAASWEVWEGIVRGHNATHVRKADWELGRVWAEKREVFYEQGRWAPLDNFIDDALDFSAMDTFISHVLEALRADGSRAVTIFPRESYAVLSYAEKLASEVIGDYITLILEKARGISNYVFLTATAAAFREAWRVVDVLLSLDTKENTSYITRTQAEDVIYHMFESNMDEYLDEEIESVQQAFDLINREWESESSRQVSYNSSTPTTARFLGSHNPAQVKRTLLASFTDVLLLPVTIVPRTVGVVGAALTTGGSAAVQGIAMLNPQRWVTSGTSLPGGKYSQKVGDNYDDVVFEVSGEDEDETVGTDRPPETQRQFSRVSQDTLTASTAALSIKTNNRSVSSIPETSTTATFAQLDLYLSLDIALELIHADREALKRVELFAGYPGRCGHRVRDTIEEIFILLLRAMGERHISPGFDRATERMRLYKPAEHEETTSVAPLMQFFELVHVGDTIQSMVQVYFDKELAPHIDKTDFLNAVVREKKRFENTLDDAVAAGMNAGTDVLMNQVEHIILTRTKIREYYPDEGAPLDLGPTLSCQEAIACLDMHCRLLKGSTSKDVLEVFYQEVGIRLLAILHRHIKRQIISLVGGFQVIADLNAYYSFISSLKVPSIATDFSNLKMLGHVYVVEDAKDLAQIVRDVTRYGGAYRPEDIYEFIQRRADWKKIEKTVDKTMYNLSFKEDCVVC